MADHSHKWHDGSTRKRATNDSSDGITATTNKLDSIGRDMKKLKENVHAIQVGCENCPPRYYTHVDNRSPFGEKKPSLEELMNKHLEESTRRRAEMEEWMKKLSENTDLNTRNQNASLNNLETQIEQLAKDYQVKVANEVPNSSVGHCKANFANEKVPTDETSSNGTNELHGVFFISDDNVQVPKETKEGPQEVLPCQLPQKNLNPGSFTLPCTIGSLKFYAMADLGASVNILPRSMFNHLKLKNLKETNLLVEMADMAKKGSCDPNETMIIGRPLLATIHDRIDVFDKEISLGVGEDIIVFDMNGNVYHPVFLIKKVCIVNEVQEEKSFNPLEIGDDLFLCDSPSCLKVKRINHICETNQNNEDTLVCNNVQEQYEGEKGMTTMTESKATALRWHYCKRLQVLRNGEFEFWPTCDPSLKECNGGDRIHGLDERGT
ncbi:7-deoxyloganetin glucosyltransferase-like protein [Tanacetum coccineum]